MSLPPSATEAATPSSPTHVPTSSLFLQPSPSSPPSPSSTTDPIQTSPPADAATGTWSSPGAGSETTGTYGYGDTHSTSDAPATPSPTTKAGIRAVCRQAIKTVTGLASGFLTRDQEEADHGLWVADEDDLTDISNPASRLIYRALPEDAKGGSNPIDLLQLGVAIAGYVAKNLQIRSRIRAQYQLDQADGETPA